MKFFNFKKSKKVHIDEDFVTQNAEKITDDDIKKVVDSASKIKSKMQANSRFDKFLADGKVMIALIRDYWKKDYTEIPWYAMTAIVFALLYVLNPLDLAPDYIPFLGYMDDVTVFSFALTLVNKDLTAYKNWKEPKEELS